MALIDLLVLVIVLALVFWVLSIIPMDQRLKTILTVIIAVIVVLYLLGALLGFSGLHRTIIR